MKRSIIYDSILFLLVILILFFVNTPYLNVVIPFFLIIIYAHTSQGLKISLGFSKPKSFLKLIGFALGLALFMHLLSYYMLLPFIEKLTGIPLSIGVFAQVKNNTTILVTSLIIGWVVGGLFEETIFRGFIISVFMEHINPKVGAVLGAILSSILFGYLHSYQGITGQILLVINGLFIAAIYIISKRNLWLCVLTHGFINTISMLNLYFGLISF